MKNTKGNSLFPFFAFPLAFFLATFLLAVQRSEPPIHREFVIGEPAPRTIFSPLHFRWVNEEETARLRKAKESEAIPVYAIDPKVKKILLRKLEEGVKARKLLLKKEETLESVSRALTLVFEKTLGTGVLEDEHKKEFLGAARERIWKIDSEKKAEGEVGVKETPSLSEIKGDAAGLLEREGLKDRHMRDVAVEIFLERVQPNLLFDESETKSRIKRAGESVSPVVEEIKRGEMVVQKGLLVTAKQQLRLIQLQKKMAARAVRNRLLSVSLFVLLGLGITFFYLRAFEPKVLYETKPLTLTLSTFLIVLGVERMTLLFPGSNFYLLPGALASILLTILWGPSLGFLGALSVPLFSAPLVELRFEIILMLWLGSLAGVFAARGIRKRIHFLKIGLAVGAVNSVVLIGYFFFQDWRLNEALSFAPLGFENGFFVTALSFFLVPLFETGFNLTTDISLLELSDLNHPLLKRMVVEAPGTYHHSLVMSSLAETACEAVGANALLARVGCYFHDIGKIARSEYFTENQTPQSGSRHEKLTPTMSCLVIMNHVKDGIELARKHKLKEVIVRFIPEHQGTGVVYYFYRKALDQAVPGEKVNADDFRYPGPKPQCRETAVALLADSVEAASRSLKEVTPATVRLLVRKIINEKFIDGQLDECDLTLKDLHKIQESFVHNLMAIFHTRVRYPSPEPDPRHPDLFKANQFIKFRT